MMKSNSFEKDKHRLNINKTNATTNQTKQLDLTLQPNSKTQSLNNDHAKTCQTANSTDILLSPLSNDYRHRLYSMRGRTFSEIIEFDDKKKSKNTLRSILKTNIFTAKNSKRLPFDYSSDIIFNNNEQTQKSLSTPYHRSWSMSLKNSLESNDAAAANESTSAAAITSTSNVHFSPKTGHGITKVLLYDPNQSAHESVISGIKPNCDEFTNNKKQIQNDCFVLTLDNEDCEKDNENDRLLTVRRDSLDDHHETHVLSYSTTQVSSSSTELASPSSLAQQTYTCPLMKVCELPNENDIYSSNNITNKETITCKVSTSTDDDPWYCEQCETWFGSPDPSYPEYCRCVDTTLSSLGRENFKSMTLSKSDTISSNDTASIYSQSMHKDFRYYFQHPILRIFIALSVIFCNFLIYGEDPISHSKLECSIPIIGNVLAFIFSKNPPEIGWHLFKIFLNFSAIILGATIGKYLIHNRFLVCWARIKMFRDNSGTWMIMGVGIVATEYFVSHIYNLILVTFHKNFHNLLIDSLISMSFSFFMKCAACGTWLGDFSTAWMIFDMMLQDNLYPCWALSTRQFWQRQKTMRIIIFWLGGFLIAGTVIIIIQLEFICWDCFDYFPFSTNELSRSFLASFILLQDLVIVMQDWDFPHFVNDLNIKLPGLLRPSYTFWLCHNCENDTKSKCEIKISGKWFNYGIIFMVMMFDLNMWKNQIIYLPENFGQYVHPTTYKIYVVLNPNNISQHKLNWNFRTQNYDPLTGQKLSDNDLLLEAQYRNYPSWIKALSFIPIAIGFASFFSLIYLYGRFPPKTDRSVGGRLIKRSSSNWQRERNHSRRVSTNHYWANILLRNRARNFMARVSDRASQFGPKFRFSLSNFPQQNDPDSANKVQQ